MLSVDWSLVSALPCSVAAGCFWTTEKALFIEENVAQKFTVLLGRPTVALCILCAFFFFKERAQYTGYTVSGCYEITMQRVLSAVETRHVTDLSNTAPSLPAPNRPTPRGGNAPLEHPAECKRHSSPSAFSHIFLGFTKCGRYVLSYTSDCGEDDDFSFYTYHLYWWEFNLHSRLKQVRTSPSTCSHLHPHPSSSKR